MSKKCNINSTLGPTEFDLIDNLSQKFPLDLHQVGQQNYIGNSSVVV
jgi:hypothetical protein